MTVASEVLDYPWPQAQIPSAVHELLGLADYISPSFYLRKGIDLAVQVDPVEWLSAEFAGDWQKVASAATALEQLGEYVYALGHDVDRMRSDLVEEWQGHAAGSASVYFDTLAAVLGELTSPLTAIADAYSTTATGIKMWGDAIADALGLLLDYLIELGIAACATGVLAATGVGALVGGAGTAYLAYKATSTWMKVVEYHGYAATAARAVTGATAGSLSLLHVDGADLALPGPYSHPAVP